MSAGAVKVYISILPEQLQGVDYFRQKKGKLNRAEAIRSLLQSSIDEFLSQEKEHQDESEYSD